MSINFCCVLVAWPWATGAPGVHMHDHDSVWSWLCIHTSGGHGTRFCQCMTMTGIGRGRALTRPHIHTWHHDERGKCPMTHYTTTIREDGCCDIARPGRFSATMGRVRSTRHYTTMNPRSRGRVICIFFPKFQFKSLMFDHHSYFIITTGVSFFFLFFILTIKHISPVMDVFLRQRLQRWWSMTTCNWWPCDEHCCDR